MAQGNITPAYGLWLKDNLSLYQFHSAEAKKLADDLKSVDIDKVESNQELIELYAKFLQLFCNSMHSVALGVDGKDISSDEIKAYLVENEYGVMTPIGLMEASKKQGKYNLEASAIAVFQKQNEIDTDIKNFASENNTIIEACNNYPNSRIPKAGMILTGTFMIIVAYFGIFININTILADKKFTFLSWFWFVVAAVVVISTILILREFNCFLRWHRYRNHILWIDKYLQDINKNEGQAVEIVSAATASIQNALLANSQKLPVQGVSLAKHQSNVEGKKSVILYMVRNYKKNRKCLYSWELLILLALNVFFFYGMNKWDYREIEVWGNHILDRAQVETQDSAAETTGEAVQKPVSYRRITVKSSEATSVLTGKKTGKKYGSDYTLDGDMTTCWQEGKDGDGKGESITYYFQEEHPLINIKIWNGRAESQQLYEENNRISSLEIVCYKQEDIVFDKTISLEDIFNDKGSTIYLSRDEAINCDRIDIKIASTYKGSKYDDTCLTDIEFYEGVY